MSVSQPSVERPGSIRVAGISRQTVSRVINAHPSLRPETRDRVLTVIEDLKYLPNPVARAWPAVECDRPRSGPKREKPADRTGSPSDLMLAP